MMDLQLFAEGEAAPALSPEQSRYQLMQVDKERVLLACRVIINDLLGKLYRYDYNVGYDCLLDDGNSVSRKLKKSNEEMEVEEDAIGDR